MKYLLDTNTCIYLIKNKPESVRKHLKKCQPGDIGLSSITVSELTYGVENSQQQKQNLEALQDFLLPFSILPFDEAAAWEYGKIRSHLKKRGTPIGSLDTLIASHAKSLNSTLITNNQKEFKRVPGLKLANWV